MKHYQEVEETVIDKKITHVTCDRCDRIIPSLDIYEIKEYSLIVKKVESRLRFGKGDSYPGSGSLEGWQVEDLCEKCVDLLAKLLDDNGFKRSEFDEWW